jgi:hypothetical protein
MAFSRKLVAGTFAALIVLGIIIVPSSASSPGVASPQKTGTSSDSPEKQEEASILYGAMGAKQVLSATPYPNSVQFNFIGVMEDRTLCYEYHLRDKRGENQAGAAVLTTAGQFKTYTDKEFPPLWHQECANKTGKDRTKKILALLNASTK